MIQSLGDGSITGSNHLSLCKTIFRNSLKSYLRASAITSDYKRTFNCFTDSDENLYAAIETGKIISILHISEQFLIKLTNEKLK